MYITTQHSVYCIPSFYGIRVSNLFIVSARMLDRQIDRQIDIRQIDRQIDRQTYRQIDIQIYRQIVCLKRFDRRKEIHAQRIEYILEGNLLEKSVKRPICCTVSILQVYFSYLCYITFWAQEHHFIENLKLMLKESQIMKQDGFIIDQ